jgi:DNA-binding LytR/AlgR family response regulator
MKIVIIEDEVKTARALAALIVSVEPGAEIVASLQSVREAVDWFSGEASRVSGRPATAALPPAAALPPTPDLVFMDIQLADGLCFDIFRETTVHAPVVFCTAYDEYAIEAFKANGIDYILKPFSGSMLSAAFQKVKGFRNHFREERQGEFRHLLQPLITPQGKNSFLVFKDGRYSVVATDDIAFFYIKGELPVLYTFDNKEYFVNQSLDTLESMLPSGKFFRATRQYLVHFSAVKEIEHYFSRKLLVHLRVSTPEKLIVSKDKSVAFLHWLDNR